MRNSAGGCTITTTSRRLPIEGVSEVSHAKRGAEAAARADSLPQSQDCAQGPQLERPTAPPESADQTPLAGQAHPGGALSHRAPSDAWEGADAAEEGDDGCRDEHGDEPGAANAPEIAPEVAAARAREEASSLAGAWCHPPPPRPRPQTLPPLFTMRGRSAVAHLMEVS